MEHPQYYAPYRIADSSSLGFPLGTAFLLVAVFTLSGIFSCCYHWHRIRLLRRRADLEAGDDPSSFKYKLNYNMSEKQNQSQNMPAVLMPGDEVPKFIALPCPCQPPRPEKVAEMVQLPPSPSPPPPPPPPKPIRMVVGLLL